ncbi:uncharacterized protein [Henckelia pumila]|uniref:uncharacterized protein n=1 Tax=Henckelia pumila TaxID=405737 RepID=UPI003C6E7263
MLTDSELLCRLREIVRCSDQRTTTGAAVRRRLEEEFAVDLYHRRAFINQQIDIFLQSVVPQCETGEVDESVSDGVVENQSACDRGQAKEKKRNDYEICRRKRRFTVMDAKEKNRAGIFKLSVLSPQLQKLVGVPELSWTEVVKKVWEYIREKNLQDPKYRRRILCDESLRRIFGSDSVETFQMSKELLKHVWPPDENREMVRKENNVVENEANRQSKKDAMSRCSATYFRKVMNKLEPNLNDKQRARIMSTPFGKWLKMPKLSIYSTRVDAILKSFNSDSSSFIFGKNIVVPFTSFEFSIVLGLPYGGQPIYQDLRTKLIFLSRYFAGKRSNATRKIISKNLLLLAESDDESRLDDFVRMFILFAMNCIVFPLSTYMTPRFVFSYIDDLSNFFGYSWGETAHRFLCDKIAAHLGDSEGMIGRKTYLDGCVVGMMAWVYEKVPSLGVVSGSPRMFPRLFKWGESKMPLKFKDAEALLKKITRTKVFNIIPFGEELRLISKRQRNTKEDTRCKIRSSEKLVEDQLNEIKILRQTRCQIDGARTNDVGVWVKGELDDEKNNGMNVLFADEIENFVKDLGGDNKLYDVDVVADFIEGDGVNCNKLDVEGNKVRTMDSSRDADESDDVGGVVGSQVETVSNVISSVVNNVMTRFDRVKKRKSNIFVTSPSSTSRRKTKSIVEG